MSRPAALDCFRPRVYVTIEDVNVAGDKARLALDNQVEASLLDAMLQQDGVPHLVRSYQDRAYGRLWQFQNGWGYVETPAQYAGGVRALLTLIRSNKFTEPEDGDQPS
jgi:hypothetical protein